MGLHDIIAETVSGNGIARNRVRLVRWIEPYTYRVRWSVDIAWAECYGDTPAHGYAPYSREVSRHATDRADGIATYAAECAAYHMAPTLNENGY